jgi:beta-glucosidase
MAQDKGSAIPNFPADFLWGTATSSYQIEGATGEDGRGPSIWDTFCHTPGKVLGGDTGDVACDHYHRYAEDVALMARLGVGVYRFSVAWPRVQPDGRGPANQPGLDFYRRLLDALDEHGIKAFLTLYHWDLPQPLEDAGGWMARDTAYRFADYAAIVGEAFRDRVAFWAPINEAFAHWAEGYALGVSAPGRTLLLDAFPAAHHLCLGHGLAVGALRAAGVTGSIGSVNALTVARPASGDPADLMAAAGFDMLRNWLFTDPQLRGAYPPELMAAFPQVAEAAGLLQPGDDSIAGAKLDFFGVNYYGPEVIRAAPENPLGFDWVDVDGGERTSMGTRIDPDGLRQLLANLRERYGEALPPIYVTENGASFGDEPDADGYVNDTARVRYLDGHVRALRAAMDEGADIRGYFVWSLLDNFEWSFGYSQRFGIVRVDFATQKRLPKASFDWYRSLIRTQR